MNVSVKELSANDAEVEFYKITGTSRRHDIARNALCSTDRIVAAFVDDELYCVASFRSKSGKSQITNISSIRNGCGQDLTKYIREKSGPIGIYGGINVGLCKEA